MHRINIPNDSLFDMEEHLLAYASRLRELESKISGQGPKDKLSAVTEDENATLRPRPTFLENHVSESPIKSRSPFASARKISQERVHIQHQIDLLPVRTKSREVPELDRDSETSAEIRSLSKSVHHLVQELHAQSAQHSGRFDASGPRKKLDFTASKPAASPHEQGPSTVAPQPPSLSRDRRSKARELREPGTAVTSAPSRPFDEIGTKDEGPSWAANHKGRDPPDTPANQRPGMFPDRHVLGRGVWYGQKSEAGHDRPVAVLSDTYRRGRDYDERHSCEADTGETFRTECLSIDDRLSSRGVLGLGGGVDGRGASDDGKPRDDSQIELGAPLVSDHGGEERPGGRVDIVGRGISLDQSRSSGHGDGGLHDGHDKKNRRRGDGAGSCSGGDDDDPQGPLDRRRHDADAEGAGHVNDDDDGCKRGFRHGGGYDDDNDADDDDGSYGSGSDTESEGKVFGRSRVSGELAPEWLPDGHVTMKDGMSRDRCDGDITEPSTPANEEHGSLVTPTPESDLEKAATVLFQEIVRKRYDQNGRYTGPLDRSCRKKTLLKELQASRIRSKQLEEQLAEAQAKIDWLENWIAKTIQKDMSTRDANAHDATVRDRHDVVAAPSCLAPESQPSQPPRGRPALFELKRRFASSFSPRTS